MASGIIPFPRKIPPRQSYHGPEAVRAMTAAYKKAIAKSGEDRHWACEAIARRIIQAADQELDPGRLCDIALFRFAVKRARQGAA